MIVPARSLNSSYCGTRRLRGTFCKIHLLGGLRRDAPSQPRGLFAEFLTTSRGWPDILLGMSTSENYCLDSSQTLRRQATTVRPRVKVVARPDLADRFATRMIHFSARRRIGRPSERIFHRFNTNWGRSFSRRPQPRRFEQVQLVLQMEWPFSRAPSGTFRSRCHRIWVSSIAPDALRWRSIL